MTTNWAGPCQGSAETFISIGETPGSGTDAWVDAGADDGPADGVAALVVAGAEDLIVLAAALGAAGFDAAGLPESWLARTSVAAAAAVTGAT